MLKSVFFLTIMSVLVCSCTNADQKKEQPTETNPSASTPSSSYSMKKVEKEVMVKEDFFQITNLSSGIIEFNQGPNKIWAEGDSASLSHLSFEFDGGILTVSTPMDANNDVVGFPSSSDIRIHVSCPDLRAMAVCSGGGFVCKETLKSDQLQLGGLVGGKIEIDSIACHSFRYDSNGSTMLNIGGVRDQHQPDSPHQHIHRHQGHKQHELHDNDTKTGRFYRNPRQCEFEHRHRHAFS